MSWYELAWASIGTFNTARTAVWPLLLFKPHTLIIYKTSPPPFKMRHDCGLHMLDPARFQGLWVVFIGGGFAAFGGGGGVGSFAAAAQKGGTFGGLAASGTTPGRPQAPAPAGDKWAPRR